MKGLHLTADLSGCAIAALLTDVEALARLAREATERSGLSVVAEHWHRFPAPPGKAGEAEQEQGQAQGFTGMLLLAESHVALHTWPELGGVTLDVYVCNYGGDNSAKARALMDALVALFQPARALRQELERG